MIENTEVYASMGLTQLAQEAVNAAQASVRNSRAAVVQAVNAGRLLIAAKAKVEHGQWKQWLLDNWQGEGRGYETAVDYIRLAKAEVDVSNAASIREALRMLAEAKMEHAPFLSESKTQSKVDSEPSPAANLTPADIPEPEPQVTTPAERESQTRPTIKKRSESTKQRIDTGTDEPPRKAVDEVFEALERLAGEQADQRDMANRLRALADKLDPPDAPATYKPGSYVIVPSALNNETALAAIGRWVDYVNNAPNSKTIYVNSPQEQELFRLLQRWELSADEVDEMVSRCISSGFDNLVRPEKQASENYTL